jgi:hypothetical protein
MTNEHLAELARERAQRYAPRTPERRAAAALYVALADTKTPDGARRVLASVDRAVRDAALVLLRRLERATTEAAARERS